MNTQEIDFSHEYFFSIYNNVDRDARDETEELVFLATLLKFHPHGFADDLFSIPAHGHEAARQLLRACVCARSEATPTSSRSHSSQK